MKKHLIAVAVAAAVAAPAAMADTTLYGLAHVSADYVDNDVDSNLNVQSASSRLGVKGTEKLSNGLSALYQIEWGVDMADSGAFSARNQFVGLTGGFGTLVAGRHDTPMKLAIAKYDLFGDQIGDNGNIVGGVFNKKETVGWNLRPGNVVAYITPDVSGFSATLAYVADHDMGGTLSDLSKTDYNNSDNNDNDAYSISAGYKHKMFDVTGAYEKHNAGSLDEKSWLIGAGVNFGGVRVNALYQDIEDFANKEAKVFGGGVSYAFGNNTIKAQYYTTDAEGSNGTLSKDRSLFALGYDYKLSKQTTVYAAYAMGDKGQTVWGDGHGGKTTCGVDKDCSAFSVGVKHSF
jgi:predicted porin